MKRSLLVLMVAAMLWTFCGTAAIAQVKGQSLIPTFQQLGRLGLERAWWAQAVMNPSRDKVIYLVIDEDVVYVQASSGLVTAFDAESGQQLWSVLIGQFDTPGYPVVTNERVALLVTGTALHALDKRTGEILWTFRLDGIPSTSPVVDDIHVYVGTMDGSVYAYNLKKILELQGQRRLPEWSSAARAWRFKTGAEVTTPPISTGKVVNFVSLDGSLYSVNSLNRKLIYQLETDRPIAAPLARLGGTMFVASEDNSFYAMNLFTGQVEWEYTSPLPIRRTIWAINHDLYLFPAHGGILCLNPTNGARRWSQPGIANFVAVLDDTMAGYDSEGNLVIIGREKGNIIGGLPMRRFNVKSGNDRTDRVYMSTESGLVLCLRRIGQIDPVYYRYPDRLPLLPEFESDTPTDSAASEPTEER